VAGEQLLSLVLEQVHERRGCYLAASFRPGEA
jgi:hypothetical protein